MFFSHDCKDFFLSLWIFFGSLRHILLTMKVKNGVKVFSVHFTMLEDETVLIETM